MSRILMGFVLYAFSNLATDIAVSDLLTRLNSPSSLFGRSASVADDDFFNEPSTMRPEMTAAAAQKDEDNRVQDDSARSKDCSYDLTARGTRVVRRAAPVA